MELLECAICGDTSLDVLLGIVAWKPTDERHVTGGFEAVPRCRDRIACRRRVELAGKPWPIISGGSLPPKGSA
jgi:hypothetical protein